MPQAWSNKDERMYEHIKESNRDRGMKADRAKEIAARTVNKQRREEGRTPNKTTQGTGNPRRGLEARKKDELYNIAKGRERVPILALVLLACFAPAMSQGHVDGGRSPPPTSGPPTRSGPPPELLIAAISSGRLGEVKRLVAVGGDVNGPDRDGRLPLNTACSGPVEIVTFLIEAGADPDAKDREGNTPLYWAAVAEQGRALQWLLDEGAYPSNRSRFGLTPLTAAATDLWTEGVEMLLAAGAAVDGHAPSSEGALASAVSASGLQRRDARRKGVEIPAPSRVIDLLLERGAVVVKPDPEGRGPQLTALHAAAGRGDPELTRRMLRVAEQQHVPVDTPLAGGASALLSLVRASNALGRDVPTFRAELTDEQRAADDRVRSAFLETARLLLDAGADPLAATEGGATPLGTAMASKNEQLVELMKQYVEPAR